MRRTFDVANNKVIQARPRRTSALPDYPPDSIDFINVEGNVVSGADVDLPHGFDSAVRFWAVDFYPSTQLGAFPIIERRLSSGDDMSDRNTLRLKVWYDGLVAIRVEAVQ